MAKNKNTFEKRRKETERMRKAADKRERRLARRAPAVAPDNPDGSPAAQGSDDGDAQSVATPPT